MKKTVKATAKTTTAKVTAAKAEDVKETVKEAVTETAKESVKESVKEEAKVAETKAAKATKTTAKKAALKEEVVLQWYGKEVNKDDLMKQVKEIWTKQMKNKVGDMKSVTLYLKPEENMVYYVINGDVTGSIEL